MNDQLLGSFVWCELLTTDTHAAGTFYKKVVGWKSAPWPHDSSYTTFVADTKPVAGMMVLPDAAKQMGAPPNWMMYIGTTDVDETTIKIVQLGGRVVRQPETIPNAGRYAVVQDPQGATFGIYTPSMAAAPAGNPTLGIFSWYELYTPDPDGAWNFYSKLFGWEKTSAMDMGEMGTYQMFGRGGGIPNGGIMKPTPGAPTAWLPYALVADAKAAAKRATRLHAKIIVGPMEVPGGDWVAIGVDPQGATFAVHSRKPAVATAAPPAAQAVAKATPAATKKAPAKKAAPKAKAKSKSKAKPAKTKAKAARKPARKAAKKTAKKTARKIASRAAARKGAKKTAKPKKSAKRAVRKSKKR